MKALHREEYGSSKMVLTDVQMVLIYMEARKTVYHEAGLVYNMRKALNALKSGMNC